MVEGTKESPRPALGLFVSSRGHAWFPTVVCRYPVVDYPTISLQEEEGEMGRQGKAGDLM